jgi:hypothetical protein
LAGNVSLAVVDKKDEVTDTLSSIVSTLLLTSELRGHIEAPMSYFNADDRRSAQALNVLMMTQGWRRYDVPGVLKGAIKTTLEYPVELSDEVKGRAEGVFAGMSEGGISLIALRDSVLGTSFVEPDGKGYFIFNELEYPDGTQFVVQALTKRGGQTALLTLDDPKPYPASTSPAAPFRQPEVRETFIRNANEMYTMENGVRVYNLDAVTVTAMRTKTKSPYYSSQVSMVLTADDVEKQHLRTIFELLRQLPGVTVAGDGGVQYRGKTPLVVLDGSPEENFDYNRVDVSDVADVFVHPAVSAGVIFGGRGANGAIILNTKRGIATARNAMNRNIRTITTKGYQQGVEFYAPRYETVAEKNASASDLRTTIHWAPNVQVDETGVAEVSFYTADPATTYSVVVEGVSRDGYLIHSHRAEIETVR